MTIFLALLSWCNSLTVGTDLTITIDNCRSDKGKIFLAIYNSTASYMKEPKAYRREIIAIRQGKASISFKDLPAGEYAIVCFHDENNNQKLDTNWVGLPTEGYGFSNNARGTFGPPSFVKAKITLGNTALTQSLRLSY